MAVTGTIAAAVFLSYLAARSANPVAAPLLPALLIILLAFLGCSMLVGLIAEDHPFGGVLALTIVGLLLLGALYLFPGFPGYSTLMLLTDQTIAAVVGALTLGLLALAAYRFYSAGWE